MKREKLRTYTVLQCRYSFCVGADLIRFARLHGVDIGVYIYAKPASISMCIYIHYVAYTVCIYAIEGLAWARAIACPAFARSASRGGDSGAYTC